MLFAPSSPQDKNDPKPELGVIFMREKGVEPSLRWNWCLKPARLPFRHSRTETLFIVARFAAKVNCRRIIPSLRPHNNPKNSEGGHGREENAAGKACGGISAAGSCGSFGLVVQLSAGPGLSGAGTSLISSPLCMVEPQRGHGSQNVASTRAVGSYQTTLTLGGWLPIKTIRAVVTERPRVTVCGTPFGVKMFSEGALIVGFSEIGQADGGTSNPAKEAGLRLGDRVICIGQTRTESNDAVRKPWTLRGAIRGGRVYPQR